MTTRFARIPEDVLLNKSLTATDLRVYGILAQATWHPSADGKPGYTGNIASVGQQLLADRLHTDRRNIRDSLEKLAKAGYISTSIHKLSGRSTFKLNSPVFCPPVEGVQYQSQGVTRPQGEGVCRPPRIDIEAKTTTHPKLVSFPRKHQKA